MMSSIKLGESQAYESRYNPNLLQPIARAPSRAQLACSEFYGEDIWTGYELSWLDASGKPQVAIAEFRIPCASPQLVESKSFKYYLNSFNQTEFASLLLVQATLEADLSRATGASVTVQLYSLASFAQRRREARELGECIDDSTVDGIAYQPQVPSLRGCVAQGPRIYVSHLLKSNCPVTGQPDWASVWCGFDGVAPAPADLLRYVISFREHQGFHEHCVERMFSDLSVALAPTRLWVYARYTRRGGLDINPLRASEPMTAPELWGARQ